MARSGRAAEATRLDQMIYAWPRRSRTGGEGHLPAASSLGSTVTRSWSGLLAGEVELDESRVPHPPSALAYLIRSPDHPEAPDHLTARDPHRIPEAALVHRIRIPERGGDSRARLRAHILIGRADYLTERVGLALYAAGGVVVGNSRTIPRLAPLHLRDLTARRRTGERTLRQSARAGVRRDRLVTLIATVLAWSRAERPFVVAHTGSDEALMLMWALVEILEGVLPYRLTFSTHATTVPSGATPSGARHTDEPGPRFLFVPFEPECAGNGEPAAIHVDPRVGPDAPPIMTAAARLLVDLHGRGGMRGIGDLLALVGDEMFDPSRPEAWCRRVMENGVERTTAPPPGGDLATLADTAGAPRTGVPGTASGSGTSGPPDPAPLSTTTDAVGLGHSTAPAAPGDPAPAATTGAGALAVREHLRERYERLRASNWSSSAEQGTAADPVRRLFTALIEPVGLPADLASVERLRGQLRRVAGLLAGPVAGPGGGLVPAARAAGPGPRERLREEIVGVILGRLREEEPAGRMIDKISNAVANAVSEEQRQVEGTISALADELAALRVPSPAQVHDEPPRRDEPLRQAVPLLAVALESIFSGYRMTSARDNAIRLATETVEALRAARPDHLSASPTAASRPARLPVTVRRVPRPATPPPATPESATAQPTDPGPGERRHLERLERDAGNAVIRHVAEAYRQEWSYWDDRLHPIDRLLAALGVPLGISLSDAAYDPLVDPLESPTELRELAALRDLLHCTLPQRGEPARSPLGTVSQRPPGHRTDVLARAASDVTQAITRRLAPDAYQSDHDRAAYIDAVHRAVTTMQREVVEMLTRLVAGLAALAIPAAAVDPAVWAGRRIDLIHQTLRALFDLFGLPEGFEFARALADEVVTGAAPTGGGSRWPPESAAAKVVRLLRETHARGADAFRLLVLYAPGWHTAEDIRDDIAYAGASPVGPPGRPTSRAHEAEVLGAGARPYFERLVAVEAASGRGDGPLMQTVRRIAGLYLPGASHEPGPPGAPGALENDLRVLGAELTARIPPTWPDGPDPAIAFLRACQLGQPNAARIFGLLVRHVPNWDDAWDLHEVIRRDGAPGQETAHPEEGPLTGPELARAAERYFRRTVRGSEADHPFPADLERVVRRLVALYLPDDPRLRAASELPGFVESQVIAAIGRPAPLRRRRLLPWRATTAMTTRVAVTAVTLCLTLMIFITVTR
ncbi:hypothetical protein CcI156_02185 [Frankia sp. CcI156]|nr:hypothetical protein CcI6DRAFT_01861 [Frankia sp. CcI6]ONH29716.1 hypothetical protein CcI156_02185 [Frankia sp. CcI156]